MSKRIVVTVHSDIIDIDTVGDPYTLPQDNCPVCGEPMRERALAKTAAGEEFEIFVSTSLVWYDSEGRTTHRYCAREVEK